MVGSRFACTSRSAAVAIVASLGLVVGVVDIAQAADCNADIAGLSQKRQAHIEKLNMLAKASKGKLDPIASCPELRGLVKAEGDLLRYLESNKNWCNVPEETVANLKAADTKSQAFAAQACNLATQAAKQKQQATTGGGGLGLEAQKLPTGPL